MAVMNAAPMTGPSLIASTPETLTVNNIIDNTIPSSNINTTAGGTTEQNLTSVLNNFTPALDGNKTELIDKVKALLDQNLDGKIDSGTQQSQLQPQLQKNSELQQQPAVQPLLGPQQLLQSQQKLQTESQTSPELQSQTNSLTSETNPASNLKSKLWAHAFKKLTQGATNGLGKIANEVINEIKLPELNANIETKAGNFVISKSTNPNGHGAPFSISYNRNGYNNNGGYNSYNREDDYSKTSYTPRELINDIKLPEFNAKIETKAGNFVINKPANYQNTFQGNTNPSGHGAPFSITYNSNGYNNNSGGYNNYNRGADYNKAYTPKEVINEIKLPEFNAKIETKAGNFVINKSANSQNTFQGHTNPSGYVAYNGNGYNNGGYNNYNRYADYNTNYTPQISVANPQFIYNPPTAYNYGYNYPSSQNSGYVYPLNHKANNYNNNPNNYPYGYANNGYNFNISSNIESNDNQPQNRRNSENILQYSYNNFERPASNYNILRTRTPYYFNNNKNNDINSTKNFCTNNNNNKYYNTLNDLKPKRTCMIQPLLINTDSQLRKEEFKSRKANKCDRWIERNNCTNCSESCTKNRIQAHKFEIDPVNTEHDIKKENNYESLIKPEREIVSKIINDSSSYENYLSGSSTQDCPESKLAQSSKNDSSTNASYPIELSSSKISKEAFEDQLMKRKGNFSYPQVFLDNFEKPPNKNGSIYSHGFSL